MLTAREWGMMIGQKIEFRDAEHVEVFTLNNVWDGLALDLFGAEDSEPFAAEDCKPVPRAIEQITKEEKEELEEMYGGDFKIELYKYGYKFIDEENDPFGDEEPVSFGVDDIDWLTGRGFDIRDWIDHGLAVRKGDNK